MKPIKKLFAAMVIAGMLPCASVMAEDALKPKEFVEEASAKGLAGIESGKMALQKSDTAEVRAFAQKMIDDHTKANQELKTIANNKNLKIADDPALMAKTKALILEMREGESFDEAYANNQVMAHEQTIELFQKAATMQDAELKAFAQKTLPKLEMYLQMAQELQTKTDDDVKDGKPHVKQHEGDMEHGETKMEKEEKIKHHDANMKNPKYEKTDAGTRVPADAE